MSTSPSLQEQIDALASRVSTIENALTLMLEGTEEPQTASAPAPAVDPRQLFAPTATEATPDLKTGNWLGIAGVVCFVFAAAFIIKLAIDSGWLTPERQIGLAGLLGYWAIGLQSDRIRLMVFISTA